MADSKLISIQVGAIKTHILDDGSEWKTAYEKTPISGAVKVTKLNVEGDDQKHKRFHGGPHRAVLMYSVQHYTYWREALGHELPYGAFGENLTVEGLDEDSVAIGDVFAIGTARFQVSQPRQPCDQISKFWKIPDLMKQVKDAGYTGWYVRVLEEGTIEAGQPIIPLESQHPEWTISRVHQVRGAMRKFPEDAAELSHLEPLNPEWRAKFAKYAQKT